MNQGPSDVVEPEWPTQCEHCGHELASTIVDVMPGGDEQLDVPIAELVCLNPDCPSKGPTSGETAAPGGRDPEA